MNPVRPPSLRWQAFAVPLLLAWPWLAAMSQCIGGQLASFSGLLLAMLLVTVTITDLRTRRIPNWATYGAVLWVVALQAALAVGPEWETVVGLPPPSHSLVGFGLGFGVMLFLYSLTGRGGGDVKLVSAIGAFLGPYQLIEMLIHSWIAAGVAAACFVVWTVGPLAIVSWLFDRIGLHLTIFGPPADMKAMGRRRMPMAPFFTFGTLAVLLRAALSSGV